MSRLSWQEQYEAASQARQPRLERARLLKKIAKSTKRICKKGWYYNHDRQAVRVRPQRLSTRDDRRALVVLALCCHRTGCAPHTRKIATLAFATYDVPRAKPAVILSTTVDVSMMPPAASPAEPCGECVVQVVEADCVDTALQLCQEGLKPLLLNMANPCEPGGALYTGEGEGEGKDEGEGEG